MKVHAKSPCRYIATLLAFGSAYALVSGTSGCGGGQAAAPSAPSVVSVTISPKEASNLLPGATQVFTATVSGSINQGVIWSVNEGSCGSVTASGTYVAPNIPGRVCHVVAASQGKFDVATVTISSISISISSSGDSLSIGQKQTFTANVQGTVNTAVTWSVEEGTAGGSITADGIYTAPQTLGTFHVTATCQADSRFVATATVNVIPIVVTISPSAVTLGRGGVRAFSSQVTNINQSVNWSIQEGPVGGSITSQEGLVPGFIMTIGFYTAPQVLGTFHVIASSVQDPTQTAIALVNIVQSGFLPTGSMKTARSSHTATVLADGRVLVTGGRATSDCGCGLGSSSAEIFDPISGTFASAGSMTAARAEHSATPLANGKVLIAGGDVSPTAELYDPSSGTFTSTGNMTMLRSFHSATLLANGKVLIAGGGSSTAELYDPSSGTFTSTGNMSALRSFHSATRLLDGRVLIAGGNPSDELATAEIFDPATGTFTSTGSMTTTARAEHSATLLASGKY